MLDINSIDVFYDNTHAVNGVSFSLEKGQIGCLLGPSGCGKTSVLRAIAGFESIRGGQIYTNNSLLSNAEYNQSPESRHIAVVFQDFALFPHLTVYQNVAFGLHKLAKSEVKGRVDELLKLVELSDYDKHFPHQLSGGQQQRVALARAMAPKPQLLLLDEPFANLDADLREDLAKQIRLILKHENTTALMVTHDQYEAFTMADKIGVMSNGVLEQWGSAYDLYHRPQSRFVADFVGEGVFIPAKVGLQSQVITALGTFTMPDKYAFSPQDTVTVLVRPDDIVHDDKSPFKAEVSDKSFRGAHILYNLQLPELVGQNLQCLAPSHHDHQVSEAFGIKLDLQHIILFAD